MEPARFTVPKDQVNAAHADFARLQIIASGLVKRGALRK
jgi:hypothetical protein